MSRVVDTEEFMMDIKTLLENLESDIEQRFDDYEDYEEPSEPERRQKERFWCSGCGNHHETTRDRDGAERAALIGWRSLGSVIYCPECVRTWADRNGPDDNRLESEKDTVIWILDKMLD